MKIRDLIIGFVGIIVMFILIMPIYSIADNFINKLSYWDNVIVSILFMAVVFLVGYWYFKTIYPDKNPTSDDDVCGNNNIKRNFYDYM